MKTFKSFDNLTHNGYPVGGVQLVPKQYRDGSLAIEIICPDGEPYMTATVNLDGWTGLRLQTKTRVYVDINNGGKELLDFLVSNEIARPTGLWTQSGFVDYPLCEFDLNKLYVEV